MELFSYMNGLVVKLATKPKCFYFCYSSYIYCLVSYYYHVYLMQLIGKYLPYIARIFVFFDVAVFNLGIITNMEEYD